ncbi:SSI family serine proteinase inhibitor [Streptomyces sp. NPDC049585]|uniref:SSI family serine proteinase inhibitor n=1 Tax=Streptomyces sp. NPDC049585 TaxID=3155154 RepID=UPI003412AE56
MSLRPLRRLARTAAILPALAPALLAAPGATAAPLPPAGLDHEDHLTIAIADGVRHGTHYELYCHPAGGTHPRAREACDQVDGQTTWAKDPFAPVPAGEMCTMMYGGTQRAHVTGTWAGRPVDAEFNRTNGCEIARWNRFSLLFGDSKGLPKKTSAQTFRK